MELIFPSCDTTLSIGAIFNITNLLLLKIIATSIPQPKTKSNTNAIHGGFVCLTKALQFDIIVYIIFGE
jgi:hypothetical protein